MTAERVPHRTLVDTDTLVERTLVVSVIADALRHDPTWKDADDAGRRVAAQRFAWMLWLVKTGEVTDRRS